MSYKNVVAIICGNGALPFELAEHLKIQNVTTFMIGICGETDEKISFYDHELLSWGQIGRLFSILAEKKITKVVLAGGIKSRPTYKNLKLEPTTLLMLPEILAAMRGGDTSIFKKLISIFAKYNIEIIGAHELAPALIAGNGCIVGKKPIKKEWINIKLAYQACKIIGKLDIGQASVAISGRVVAVEGAEGTDELLRRVSDLRIAGKIFGNQPEGVLVKTLKPGQNTQIDLPAIGIDTVKFACLAGLKGIAVDGDYSIILQRREVIKLAKSLGMFIYGIHPGEV